MKRFNSTITLLIVAAGLFTACETEPRLFKGPEHVRFTETSLNVKESRAGAIQIEVHLAGPAATNDVVVNYAITGTARSGVDYTIPNNARSITIRKGEYKGYVTVNLINNANNIIRSQNVIFTIQSVSESGIEVGQGPSAIGKSFTLTIEDDCILSGSYSGRINTFDVPTRNISVTSNDCENYVLSNWNLNIFNPPFDMDLTFVDNGDNTITIPEQDEEFLGEDEGTIRGIGVVDPVTRRLTITLTFVDFDEQQLTLVFTPQ